MTHENRETILFPEEIVPWNEMVTLVVNLQIPFRHRATGIDCITGGLFSFQTFPGGPIDWLPPVVKEAQWRFIKDHLHELPSLRFPISPDTATDFIIKFIQLEGAPDIVPTFLTTASLDRDREKRLTLFKVEKEELQKLALGGRVFLVDSSRRNCTHLTQGVYFARHEAIQYLGKKGLLDRAYASGCGWREQISEPEQVEPPSTLDGFLYGFPQELIQLGIKEYRKTLAQKRLERLLSQVSVPPEGAVVNQSVAESSTEEIAQHQQALTSDAAAISCEVDSAKKNAPSPLAESPSVLGNSGPASRQSASTADSENDKSRYSKKHKTVGSVAVSPYENGSAKGRLIGMKEVMELLDVSRPTIYNYATPDSPSYNPNFPQPLKANGINKWYESDISAFVDSLAADSKKRDSH